MRSLTRTFILVIWLIVLLGLLVLLFAAEQRNALPEFIVIAVVLQLLLTASWGARFYREIVRPARRDRSRGDGLN